MPYHDTIAVIEAALREPLPGAVGHGHLAPRPRREWPKGFHPSQIRDAAGLMLLFPKEDEPHIILTLRAGTLGRHSGQVSLPGGVIDPGETVQQAALREAFEEIALEPTSVRILGTLTPLDIPVSGFRLNPVVACIDHRPRLEPAAAEVARILEISLTALRDPSNFSQKAVFRDGRSLEVPTFCIEDVEIWGATAMAVAELLVLLGWRGPASR